MSLALKGEEAPTAASVDEDTVLSVAQVTQLLGIDQLTLLRMRKRGDGPAFVQLSPNRIGYIRRDIRDFLASKRLKRLGEGMCADGADARSTSGVSGNTSALRPSLAG
jgi:predicted DNA-binding transcriptional regulator AlpA